MTLVAAAAGEGADANADAARAGSVESSSHAKPIGRATHRGEIPASHELVPGSAETGMTPPIIHPSSSLIDALQGQLDR